MKLTSRYLSLFIMILIASALVSGCSDDESTGPEDYGPAINMNLRLGDTFYYNGWELDANNEKVGDPVEYRIKYKDNGDLSLDGTRDWMFWTIEQKNGTWYEEVEELRIRTAPNGNLLLYSFQYDIYTEFFEMLKQFDPTITVPSIGNQGWDIVGQFNDDAGNALAPGTEWLISPENKSFNLNVTVQSIPLSIEIYPIIKGIYDGHGADLTVQGETVKTWNTTISIVMKIRSELINQDITVNQRVSYSDNPPGQVIFTRETMTISIPLVGDYTEMGETRELTRHIPY